MIRAHASLLAISILSSLIWSTSLSAQVAVRGKIVHTLAGEALEDSVVVVEDGKITAIGPASSTRIPEGLRELEAEVVTPGLIDVRSTLGLSGAYNSNVGPVRDQDQLETSAPIQPELRALDAYNAREELIAYARSFGVTTIHTGHGPGALMSGRTMIVKTRGDSVDEAMIEPGKMIAVTIGNLSSQFKSPGTKAKGIAMLRGALLEAQSYAESLEPAPPTDEDDEAAPPRTPQRDLRKETLAAVLDGEIALMVNANSAVDIAAALRLQSEFGFEMVIDGGAEAYVMLDELKEADVAVFLHPPRARIRNKSLETAKLLLDAGIPFAVQTGFEAYVPKTRVLLLETAHYAANGLSRDEALAAITIDSARLLGIDERVGSIEVGKDGDLVFYTGDPFEYTTQVCGVVIEGEVVSEECR